MKSFLGNFFRHLVIFSGHTDREVPSIRLVMLLYDLCWGFTILVSMGGVSADRLILASYRSLIKISPDIGIELVKSSIRGSKSDNKAYYYVNIKIR